MEKEKGYKPKCPDCDSDLDIAPDTVKGEIYSCPGCGLELVVKELKKEKDKITYVSLEEITIEGEDWGE